MAYVEHDAPGKSQKVITAAVGLVEKELTVAKLVSVSGVDQFKGAIGDTLTQRVPGRLPGRTYKWRDEVRDPIVFDVYKEGKVDVTFGGHAYSGVQLSDEQAEFDLLGDFGVLLPAQCDAVARILNEAAVDVVTGAEYLATVGQAEQNLRGAIIEARRLLNGFRVPSEQRVLLVGTDFESALLLDDKIALSQNSSEQRAENSLANATIGNLYGFRVVVDQTIEPDEAYAFVGSGFKLLTAAPAVPRSVPFGTTKSWKGFSLRWLRDYDPTRFVDRSVVDAWYGTSVVEDIVMPSDNEAIKTWDPDSLEKHFLRGVKLHLTDASAYAIPADVVKDTGVKNEAWKPSVTVPTVP